MASQKYGQGRNESEMHLGLMGVWSEHLDYSGHIGSCLGVVGRPPCGTGLGKPVVDVSGMPCIH